MEKCNICGELKATADCWSEKCIAGYLSVPAIPEPECIESMCLRYGHSYGLKRYIYSKQREETAEEFECRREGTRRIMRQLYEEATGQGFFQRPQADKLSKGKGIE